MLSISSIVLAVAAATRLANASPFLTHVAPREFYIRIEDADNGRSDFNGLYGQTYHTGAGLADFVFGADPITKFFLNGTYLQVDVNNQYAFSVYASIADVNYARWEPTRIQGGYGYSDFILNGTQGLQLDQPEFGSWLICEWYHGTNIPQLFVGVDQFDGGFNGVVTPPKTCANVKLVPEYVTS